MSSDSDVQSETGEIENGKKRRQQPMQSKSKKRAIGTTSTQNDDLMLEKALAIMEKQSDEFDIFGQFIASEMRQLPSSSYRIVKSEIMKIVMQYGASTTEPINNHFQAVHSHHQPNYQHPAYPSAHNYQLPNNNPSAHNYQPPNYHPSANFQPTANYQPSANYQPTTSYTNQNQVLVETNIYSDSNKNQQQNLTSSEVQTSDSIGSLMSSFAYTNDYTQL